MRFGTNRQSSQRHNEHVNRLGELVIRFEVGARETGGGPRDMAAAHVNSAGRLCKLSAGHRVNTFSRARVQRFAISITIRWRGLRSALSGYIFQRIYSICILREYLNAETPAAGYRWKNRNFTVERERPPCFRVMRKIETMRSRLTPSPHQAPNSTRNRGSLSSFVLTYERFDCFNRRYSFLFYCP